MKIRTILMITMLLLVFGAKAADPSNPGISSTSEGESPVVQNITKADFLSKIMDYEKNPTQWVFKGNKPCIVTLIGVDHAV